MEWDGRGAGVGDIFFLSLYTFPPKGALGYEAGGNFRVKRYQCNDVRGNQREYDERPCVRD